MIHSGTTAVWSTTVWAITKPWERSATRWSVFHRWESRRCHQLVEQPTPGTPHPVITRGHRVSAYADWIDMICAGITTKEFLVNTVNVSVVTTGATTTADSTTTDSTTDTGATDDIYQKGVQIWSDVAVDDFGNFVITWTGFNQDGYGDTASGGSSNGWRNLHAPLLS